MTQVEKEAGQDYPLQSIHRRQQAFTLVGDCRLTGGNAPARSGKLDGKAVAGQHGQRGRHGPGCGSGFSPHRRCAGPDGVIALRNQLAPLAVSSSRANSSLVPTTTRRVAASIRTT